MYELYTIFDHESKFMKACGITFGLAAVDQNINSKSKREKLFPLDRLTRGIEFQMCDAEV